MNTKAELHYCRHCPAKMKTDKDTTAHAQWVEHYRKDHDNIAPYTVYGDGVRCGKNCIGAPLEDERREGLRLWGRHVDRRSKPSYSAMRAMGKLFKDD